MGNQLCQARANAVTAIVESAIGSGFYKGGSVGLLPTLWTLVDRKEIPTYAHNWPACTYVEKRVLQKEISER